MLTELLIRTVDKGPETHMSKRGHVVVGWPEGHAWSEAELSNPAWMRFTVDLEPIELDALMAAGDGLYRARKVDIDGLAAGPVSREDFLARVS
jgi:hypothetical protein